MTSNVFPAPASGGLVAPISGAVSLQRTYTSTTTGITYPTGISLVYAVCVSGGGGGYSQGTSGQASGGGGGYVVFGVTLPVTVATIGAGAAAGTNLATFNGGTTTFGSITSVGPAGLDWNGSGIVVQWIYGGAQGGTIGNGGGGQGGQPGVGGNGNAGGGTSASAYGGYGGPYAEYGGTTPYGTAGGFAGNATTVKGGLGGGGGGNTSSGNAGAGGNGIIYLYW